MVIKTRKQTSYRLGDKTSNSSRYLVVKLTQTYNGDYLEAIKPNL